MPLKKGPKAAADLLANLPASARDKVIDEMRKQNPEMTEALLKMMITIEDLQFITPKMLQELLREIDLTDLAKSLRIASAELKNFLFKNISNTIKKDIEDILLGPPLPVNKVQEAQERIMVVVRKKVEKGELIITRGKDEYV